MQIKKVTYAIEHAGEAWVVTWSWVKESGGCWKICAKCRTLTWLERVMHNYEPNLIASEAIVIDARRNQQEYLETGELSKS